MAFDTFRDFDILDLSDPHIPPPRDPTPTGPDIARVYFSDMLGRRARRAQHVVQIDSASAAAYVRSLLALFGRVGVYEARLFGKVIHGVGSEGGVMAVHVRHRYNW